MCFCIFVAFFFIFFYPKYLGILLQYCLHFNRKLSFYLTLMSQETKELNVNNEFNLDDMITKLTLNFKDKIPIKLVNLDVSNIEKIINLAQNILQDEPSLLYLEAPMTIVGSIKGHYNDLLRIFYHSGEPNKKNYLFLGSYVDFGSRCIETICLLLLYKIKFKENFFLLRGNHDCATMNRIYGFYDECKRRYSVKLWKQFTTLFNYLPIASIICDKILCLHAGLSPELKSFKQINDIPRPISIPSEGLLCDLLYSCPETIIGWHESDRGISYVFGPDVVDSFCKRFSIDLICRSKEVKQDGYEFFSGRQLVTIFSAPNYCGDFDNNAAIMSIDENLKCSMTMFKLQRK